MLKIVACLLVSTAAAPAVIIDRVAVSVGDQVITQSEIDHEIRLTAFLNGDKADFSAASKRQAANRLIEQKLIKKEMEIGQYPAAAAAEGREMLERYEKARFHTPAALDRELRKYGLSAEDLESHMLWQATLLRFIDVRFRPAIQVSAQDIRRYYEKNIAPKLKPGQPSTLVDARDAIRQTLIGERADAQMNEWLKETRARTAISFHEEAFQ